MILTLRRCGLIIPILFPLLVEESNINKNSSSIKSTVDFQLTGLLVRGNSVSNKIFDLFSHGLLFYHHALFQFFSKKGY